MFVKGDIWITDYSDVDELRKKLKAGYRFVGDVVYDVAVVKNQQTYYRFKSTENIKGYLYVTENRIKDLFDLLGVSVVVEVDGNTFVFGHYGMTINRKKTVVYRRDTGLDYFPQKDCYKGISPYGAVPCFVNVHRYRGMKNTLVNLGYIARAEN